jgi:two-component system, OmpR family, phosphate regulon sensor histidine kinase PhoR
MQQLKNIRWLPIVMLITIIGITIFQVYWLNDTYKREKWNLERMSNYTFRETVHTLQAEKLRIDKELPDSTIEQPGKLPVRMKVHHNRRMVGLVNVLRDKAKDSIVRETFLYSEGEEKMAQRKGPRRDRLMLFMSYVDSLQDSVKVKEICEAYTNRIQQQNINVPFSITKYKKDEEDGERVFNEVTIGFSNPVTYRLELGNTFPYLIRRISTPILLSLVIVGFTIFSFILLYKNLMRQKRLADIKNEFISNITHELKTPIATVSVAIEALRSFNASIDPKRSKEYLDISANELQRLSLLVDKVLKLSMFEKKEVDLRYEHLDMQHLIEEVASSMRLQFEKKNAAVSISSEGDTTLEGDRLHLVSVIFNLLDNALKYSYDSPTISIEAIGNNNKVNLAISDDGIGIPDEYKGKIFEKFFRVPTGNLHNAKGYGLGLSYVAQVVEKHRGTIKVESAENRGSKFIITLPKNKA